MRISISALLAKGIIYCSVIFKYIELKQIDKINKQAVKYNIRMYDHSTLPVHSAIIAPSFSRLGTRFVDALRYKPEGRGIDSRWCHWNFSLT